ncbi:MAG: hypothetical protein ETSY1_45770 [Candidatus Entotheonella factor]|uniref:Uncharacterized protein n=1 Tax=Entotheonella factor TaxID=1429438 RepID=W4L268_ENTF1|nr:MAG: hypothetical protein ETSY1_45770 [Candidatus Entotheonella factor]
MPAADGKVQLIAPGGSTLVMRMTYTNSDEADQVDELLGYKAARLAAPDGGIVTRIALTNALTPSAALYDQSVTEVKVVLRSFFDLLFYISQGIELPASERQKAMTFGGESALKDVITIRSSGSKPDDAFLAVRHHGHWFFIRDHDLLSKDAFQLLMVLFALQAASGSAGPNLTLPVGR